MTECNIMTEYSIEFNLKGRILNIKCFHPSFAWIYIDKTAWKFTNGCHMKSVKEI